MREKLNKKEKTKFGEREAAEQRKIKRELFNAEESKVKSLREEVNHWYESQKLRNYIDARCTLYLETHAEIAPESEFAQWLEWAKIPSILDEIIPEEPEQPRFRWGR